MIISLVFLFVSIWKIIDLWYYEYVNFQKYLLNQPYIQNILHKKVNNEIGSGYLFSCQDAVTLDEVLTTCAKIILCKNSTVDNCPTCQKIQCGSHPDVCVYPKKDSFSTEDSQGVIDDANKKAILGEYKIIIIKNLDNSSEQSQNKLLKILETPPKNCIFLISTTNINKVLPTVRSRLLKVEVTPFDEKTLCEIFDSFKNIEDFSLAVEYSNGYVGEMQKILTDSDFIKTYNIAKDIVISLKSSDNIVNYLMPKITKSQFSNIITLLQSMYIDIAYVKIGKTEIVKNKSLLQHFLQISDEFSLKAIVEIVKRINEVNKKQYSNVTQALLFESLLTSILEVKYLCK